MFRKVGGPRRWLGAGLLVLSLSALSLTPAVASGGGSITRAIASADWMKASIAGSASWSVPCFVAILDPAPGWEVLPHGPNRCNAITFATLGPGDDIADCDTPGRGSPDAPGPGISVPWSKDIGRRGSASFELTEIALDGAAAPLLCLSVLEETVQPDICVGPIGGGPPILCPIEEQVIRTVQTLAAATLAAEPTPSPPSASENHSAAGPMPPALERSPTAARPTLAGKSPRKHRKKRRYGKPGKSGPGLLRNQAVSKP